MGKIKEKFLTLRRDKYVLKTGFVHVNEKARKIKEKWRVDSSCHSTGRKVASS
jgi:hypothetical protein